MIFLLQNLLFLGSRSGKNSDRTRDWHVVICSDDTGTVYSFFASSSADASTIEKFKTFITGDRVDCYLMLTPALDGRNFRVALVDIRSHIDRKEV